MPANDNLASAPHGGSTVRAEHRGPNSTSRSASSGEPEVAEGVLKLTSVNKKFGNFHAVKSLSLEATPGEAIVILGPSGCGKSTTLRMIAGLEEPDSGTISLGDRTLADGKTSVRPELRNMSVVFQSYALWPHMTVHKHVAFGPRLRRRRSGRDTDTVVAEAISAVQLDGLEDRYPDQLSGGQQQRVALARAIAIEPSLLLLDEPLSNLDTNLREEMRTQIKRLHRQLGVTMLYVTHDQAEALSIADRIVVMREGRIEQLGTAQELYHRPATEYVAKSLGACNFLNGTVVDRSAGVVRVHTEEGATLALSDKNFPEHKTAGTDVTLAVRPTAVSLSGSTSQGGALTARVDESMFYGDTTHLTLTTTSNQPLRVVVSGSASHTIGEEVSVEFDPDLVSALA